FAPDRRSSATIPNTIRASIVAVVARWGFVRFSPARLSATKKSLALSKSFLLNPRLSGKTTSRSFGGWPQLLLVPFVAQTLPERMFCLSQREIGATPQAHR